MRNCIFCKIAKDKQKKIYENKGAFCILDKNQTCRNHCLIITKRHFKNIYDIDEKSLKDVFLAIKKVSTLLKRKYGAEGINILHASGKPAQQSVFHFHIHVLPRYKHDGLNMWPSRKHKK